MSIARSAHDYTCQLGGTWYRHYGTAPCPICQPERREDQNALTLSDGASGLLAHCKKSACNFRDITSALNLPLQSVVPIASAVVVQRTAERLAEARKRSYQARRVWEECLPISGTPAETYLRNRRISCDLGPILRFHPQAWHGATAKRIAAMVAFIEGGEGCAIHRTYLQPDGSGKAEVAPAKALLGATSGGAVRLTEGDGPLIVAEGIETALSLSCGLLPWTARIWAALSTSGIRGLRLPPEAGGLIIAPDGDAAGRSAAQALADRAQAVGWQVSLLTAPNDRDWNDVLTMKGKQS